MEESNKKIEYLIVQIDENINKIKDKSKNNKRLTSIVGVSSLILSASVTLSLGLEVDESYAITQKNSALFLSALLTIVNGWSLIFNYRKLWVRQKKTLLNLYQIKNKVKYEYKSESIEESKVDELFESYLNIWDKDSNDWTQIHQLKRNNVSEKER